MNTIDQTKNGCFILEEAAFNVRTKIAFGHKVLAATAIKVDGIYTYKDESFTLNYKNEKIYDARHQGTNVYDQRNATLLVNGELYKCAFYDMHNIRIRYYINSDGEQAMVTVARIAINVDDVFYGLKSKNVYNKHGILMWTYALVTNMVLPDMDMMATKLVSH